MNLTLFFRLILMSIFQKNIAGRAKMFGEPLGYHNVYFWCPRVWAMDGWNISLQIHSGNYCESNSGYRMLGHTMQSVEWGFPSSDEPLLKDTAEEPDNITGTVGRISLEDIENIFAKHGGVDWEKTISIEQFEGFVKD